MAPTLIGPESPPAFPLSQYGGRFVFCGRWEHDQPCGLPAVERLAFLNVNICGGALALCAEHLREWASEALL